MEYQEEEGRLGHSLIDMVVHGFLSNKENV